jgi:hypothetical protein
MCCDASMGASENIEARIAFATTKAQAPIVLKKTLSLLRSADLTQRILPSLQYDEIHVREDRIPEAHASTFEWVFKKQELGFTDWATHSEDGLHSPPRHRGIMLTIPTGLYWITGKPGSGKSTLIKFIVGQRRTRKLLEMWSGEKRLCIAHHYFWCSGTSLQKSQYGLLRSILLQLFQQCPELLPRVLPRHIWESRSDFHGRRWTMAELVETTKALRHQEDLGVKFCLFIDGLDEYDGEPSDLVKLLDYISQPSFLKLCVSSRPWNAFTNAYGERKQLAVQSLTQGDLRCYISDTLRDSTLFLQFQQSDPEGAALLLGEVCSKAQGVFLWVYLVGRSLRRGLENNDSLEILLARVREMPDSLDGFFRRMFERVESVYKLQAARILLAAYHADYALPLSAPEHISREIANPNYAMEMRVQADEMVVSHDEIRRARIVLDARCGDLLEASCHGISCLHRTVKDFLRQDEIAPNLRMLAGQKFDVGMCLSRLALAVVKGGEAGDLAMQVGRIIRAESLTSHENLPGLVRLLEDVDDIGEQLFAVGYNDLDADSYAESKLAQDLRDSLAKYTTKAATRRC